MREFNAERPHEALDRKCPAELYTASTRPYEGLPELTYPFHDRDVLITACGRLCLHRKKINISTVPFATRTGGARSRRFALPTKIWKTTPCKVADSCWHDAVSDG